MGQILRGSARTTEAVRRAIQHSQEHKGAGRALREHVKTVAKWKRRTITADAPMGPKVPSSTVLTLEEEAIIVAFRKHTLLPLDDCPYTLQATITHLTHSSLHRYLQRHGISRLPEIEGDKPNKKKFKGYLIGFFHIDIVQGQTEEGKLYLFVVIDRTSKIAFARLEREANRLTATAFLECAARGHPLQNPHVLTDNGIQFAYLPKNRNGTTPQFATHMFSLRCRQNGIEHRLTKPDHPWTNGQVERMNRTLIGATVKRYHYESHNQARGHLAAFLAAYNFAKRLKTLRGLTPHEYVCKVWNAESATFRRTRPGSLRNYTPKSRRSRCVDFMSHRQFNSFGTSLGHVDEFLIENGMGIPGRNQA